MKIILGSKIYKNHIWFGIKYFHILHQFPNKSWSNTFSIFFLVFIINFFQKLKKKIYCRGEKILEQTNIDRNPENRRVSLK